VSPRDAIRDLGFGRVALGALMMLFPRLAGRMMLGPGGSDGFAPLLMRMTGARDVLIGAMVVHTSDNPQVSRRWAASAGAIDAVDFMAAVSARDRLPFAKRLAFYVVAGGSSVAHLALSQQITSASGLESVAAQSPPAPASSPETVMPDGAEEAKRMMGARTINVPHPGSAS
jgi:hypothetical protein